ncbi:hypothetical protein BY996DRAFT_7717428 [Phakopsora pachyrhizi]|uniref:SET domain-containing protein n=1 Tax=Phakopsora pachyrhizi TaxID=170000 RepID=A0AAV0BQX8_PHAPC|nr:hypothetical protein BY996DRAFT_7837278 [Phakopsora pachyrhizi]KAI8447338.1 hypothetical protein BY996DRAFT_7717428 [Phakopsora pachyrhizi]CAH7669419.1 hypothetical protein PPACK8108_LOCUS4039 [Phakopsora pachyrhizi]CAH7688737.1 hypothetical protein PPACK8108_LOCUS23741 [Phakopsora pachyrhizi]
MQKKMYFFLSRTLAGSLVLNNALIQASSNYVNQLEYQLSYFNYNETRLDPEFSQNEMTCNYKDHVFDNSDGLVYKYDRVPPQEPLGKPWRDGFAVVSCHALTNDPEEEKFCFFLNPEINQGNGLVVFTRPSTMIQSLEGQINLERDTLSTSAVQLVSMPEKGGVGALASRSIMAGERVTQDRALAVVSVEDAVYQSGNLWKIRKMAIDMLPLHSRRRVALMIGSGKSEEEWISNAFDVNSFTARLGNGVTHFALISGEPTRLNHACRPNTAFYFNGATLEVFMHALKPIKAGEELTVSYHRMDRTFEERQKDLKRNYEFDCRCSHCSMSEVEILESDKRIRRIDQIRDAIMNKKVNITKSLEDEMTELYEKEDLLQTIWDLYFTLAVGNRYLENYKRVQFYLEKSLKWIYLVMDHHSQYVYAFRHFIEHPELLAKDKA